MRSYEGRNGEQKSFKKMKKKNDNQKKVRPVDLETLIEFHGSGLLVPRHKYDSDCMAKEKLIERESESVENGCSETSLS